MRNYLFYIFIGLIFLSSCGTDPPVVDDSQSVFYVRGVINGEKINLNAGDNNYYMLSYFEEDTLGIRAFGGKLGPFTCVGDVNCPQSVVISIREKEPKNGIKEPVEESVFERECDVRGPATYLFKSFKASFYSKSFPSGMTHSWDFGDGGTSSDKNPIHYYINSSDSIVTPSLVVYNATNSCQNSVGYQVNFVAPCDVDFTPQYNSPIMSLNPTPTFGRTNLWSYNGDLYEDYLVKGPPSDSITLVCLESTEDATNCVAYKCKNVVLDTASVGCVANFDVVKETVTLKDVKDYLEVTVTWQNESGKVFQSDLFEQPTGNGFEIIEVIDYKENQDGDPTKMVTVKFNLRLFGVSPTDFVDFTSEKSVIAIAYPKI